MDLGPRERRMDLTEHKALGPAALNQPQDFCGTDTGKRPNAVRGEQQRGIVVKMNLDFRSRLGRDTNHFQLTRRLVGIVETSLLESEGRDRFGEGLTHKGLHIGGRVTGHRGMGCG